MKAIIYNNYGSPEELHLAEVKKPIPTNDEVLIKIHATTVNRTDCGALSGKPYIFRLFIGGIFKPKNKIIGSVFAGEIEAIGKGVHNFKVGDRVFGFDDEILNSFAEYTCLSKEEAMIKMPKDCTFEEAAANCEGTHYAINFINKVKLTAGQKVLVNGATGAIGSAAVQLLKNLNLEVVAVANTKNLDLVKSLGAIKVIDYLKEDFTKILKDEKFDFIFDAVGKSSFSKCKPFLNPGGIYISSELGWMAENLFYALTTPFFGKKKVIFPLPKDTKTSLEQIKELMEKGKLKAVIDSVHPLEKIPEIFKYVLTGEKIGNVVIKII
ncbi:MAG: NAD(P)-dependent alcohol dehydrogenase [Saprospiraceae bacterium]